MIMEPLGAVIIKKVDGLFKERVKPSLEMLVDNFSSGIVGFFIAIAGFLMVELIFRVMLTILSSGVSWLTERNFISVNSIFVQPAQVLFIN